MTYTTQLRPGQVACLACGVACPAPTAGEPDGSRVVRIRPLHKVVEGANGEARHLPGPTFTLSRCRECLARFHAWKPGFESLAAAVRLSKLDGRPSAELLAQAGLANHPKDGPAHSLLFVDWVQAGKTEDEITKRASQCSAAPFSHVPAPVVAELKKLRLEALAAAMNGGRLPLPASSAAHLCLRASTVTARIVSGCIACGRASIEVEPGTSPADVWHPIDVNVSEFPTRVTGTGAGSAVGILVGLACPDCLPHLDEGWGVGGELTTSLLGPAYGIDHESGDGRMLPATLLFASLVLHNRRKGLPEPPAGEPWAHLPRNANGSLRAVKAHEDPSAASFAAAEDLTARRETSAAQEAARKAALAAEVDSAWAANRQAEADRAEAQRQAEVRQAAELVRAVSEKLKQEAKSKPAMSMTLGNRRG